MAARDAQFYNYLKEALKNKLRYPEASSFQSGKYFFDYEYIFQQARRVLPQKYSIGHSYYHGIPISYLNKQELSQLNLEFARDVVAGWGGLEEAPTDQRYLDPVLVEYEEELTAPDEPDSFHQELEQHQLPPKVEEKQDWKQESEYRSQATSGGNKQQTSLRYITQRSANKQPERKPLNTGKSPEQKQKLLQIQKISQKSPQSSVSEPHPANTMPPKRNALPERSNRISVKTRKVPQRVLEDRQKKQAAAALFRGKLNSGSGVPLVPKLLQRWPGQLARGAWNAVSSLGRTVANTITRGITQLLPRLGGQTALQAGRSASLGAGTFLAGGGGALLAGALAIVLGGLALFLIQQNELFSDCGKPGTVSVNKSAKSTAVKQGEEIEFELLIFYRKNCAADQIENVEVRDTIPQDTKFIENSDSASSVELVDPLADPLDDIQIDNSFPATVDLPRDNPNDVGATGLKPTLENNTLVWKIGSLSPNIPVVLNFKIKAPVTDTWIANQATVTYKETTIGAASTDGASYPVTQDNCNGTYKLGNPLGNFGDVACDFKKDDLYTLLNIQNPKNAAFWFYNVVRCESGYNPNSWRDPNITPKTPDPAGAWGLYQMGRGRNGPFDRGDVPWKQQTINAVTYARGIPSIGAYWACARYNDLLD